MSVASSDISSSSLTSGYLSQQSTASKQTSKSSLKLKRRWIDMSTSSGDKDIEQPSAKKSTLKQKTNVHTNRLTTLPSPFSSSSSSSSVEPTPYLFPMVAPVSHDPRNWSKADVQSWLILMSYTHQLDIDRSRFDMNGKALCLMNMEMFVSRVPTGGKLLYKDFKLRLHRAVFLEDFQQRQLLELSNLFKMQQAAFQQAALQQMFK